MTERNADLDTMYRLVRRHEWNDIDDWVRAVGALADLTDAEIEQVANPQAPANGAAERLRKGREPAEAK